MTSALIGYTGFVGSTLANVESFDMLINRANLDSLQGQHVERIICAGLPAAKWLINREPAEDLANMKRLCEVLSTVTAHRFTLISTIDVYPRTSGGNEDFDCAQETNHPYGSHRLQFEQFMRERFPAAHIIRLPGLFGRGLKKNVIFDLLHDNRLEMINPESRFQWYPLSRLASDIKLVELHRLSLVNLFTEPVLTKDILQRFFPSKSVGQKAGPKANYDLQTRYGKLFGGSSQYIMSSSQVLDGLEQYLAAERSQP